MASQKPVFITTPLRTPIGAFGKSLRELSAPELGTHIAQAVLEKSGINAEDIDQVIMGHARQAGCGPNPARQVAYFSKIPKEKEAFTINQACNSGLKAIMLAANAIQGEEANLILAGGMESMSNTPYLLPKARWGMRHGHDQIVDGMVKDGFLCPMSELVMGETAENLVEKYKISREEQDKYAVKSQNRTEKTIKEGLFKEQIISIELKNGKMMNIDEHPRKGVTLESLKKLKPVFKENGTIHAGNSSGITDGAAAVLVTNEKGLKQIKDDLPKARIVGFSVLGVDPHIMGIGPVPAIKKVLEKTKMKLDQMDLIELNEAFAAQVLACDRELHFDPEKLNVNGGAIALGHPIGASGARIVVTLLHEMKRRKLQYGLATLCVSGGLGAAMILERA